MLINSHNVHMFHGFIFLLAHILTFITSICEVHSARIYIFPPRTNTDTSNGLNESFSPLLSPVPPRRSLRPRPRRSCSRRRGTSRHGCRCSSPKHSLSPPRISAHTHWRRLRGRRYHRRFSRSGPCHKGAGKGTTAVGAQRARGSRLLHRICMVRS